MPLTILWSAPNTLCPSPYCGLHQTLYAPHHIVVCIKHSMPLTILWSASNTLCPSPYCGLHQTRSSMPLTIWWSAPNTLCPSPYSGLHQTLYAPHRIVVCTKHSHLCPSPYGGLLNVAQNSVTVHGASVRADLCSYLTPPHVSSLGFLCNTQNETSCRDDKCPAPV